MRIACWQTILIKYRTLFFSKIKMLQNLSSAAVVLGALRVKTGIRLLSFYRQSLLLSSACFLRDPDRTASWEQPDQGS